VSVLAIDDVRPDLIPALREIILDASTRRPTSGSSNVGGWKSTVDFLSWPEPAIRELAAELGVRARERIAAPILRSWAMINRAGSYHAWHHHGMELSGVYYVAPGNPAVPTLFRARASRDAANHEPCDEIACEPRVGRLVLFGNLIHGVPVYDGAEPRITIAFDVGQTAQDLA
jgi:hypothetical protein